MEKTNFESLWSSFESNSKVKDGIYSNIPKNATDKEKKALRVKNRHFLENAIEGFYASNKEKKILLAKSWEEYSKKVFKNAYILFDANKSDEKATQISKFVADIKALQK